MTTHDELLEFLEELSAFRWLAEQAGAERLLLDEIELGRWEFFGFLLALIGVGLLIGHDVMLFKGLTYSLSYLESSSALASLEPVLQSGCNQ